MTLAVAEQRVRVALELVEKDARSAQLAVFGIFSDRPMNGYKFMETFDVHRRPIVDKLKLPPRFNAALVLAETGTAGSAAAEEIKACIKNSGGVTWVQGIPRANLLALLAQFAGPPVLDDLEDDFSGNGNGHATAAAVPQEEREEPEEDGRKEGVPQEQELQKREEKKPKGRRRGRLPPEKLLGEPSRPEFKRLDKDEFPNPSGTLRAFMIAQIPTLPHKLSINEIGRELYRRAGLVGRSTTESAMAQAFRHHLIKNGELNSVLELVNVKFVPKTRRYIVTARPVVEKAPDSSVPEGPPPEVVPTQPIPAAEPHRDNGNVRKANKATVKRAPEPPRELSQLPLEGPEAQGRPSEVPSVPSAPVGTDLPELAARLAFADEAVRFLVQTLEGNVEDLHHELLRHQAFEKANPVVKLMRETWEKAQK